MLYPQTNEVRTCLSLDGLWNFSRKAPTADTDFPSEGFLAVPGSWNEQNNDLYHYHGRVWYRRTFRVPSIMSGQAIFLHFGGALYQAEVFLDGLSLGRCDFGLLPFEFDISNLTFPSNCHELVVAVDGFPQPKQAIGTGDFYEYGGLHRHVSLVVLPTSRLSSCKVDTSLTPRGGGLELKFEATHGDRLEASICGITETCALTAGVGSMTFAVPGIIPWSCDSPQLYDLQLSLFAGNEKTDVYRLAIGFREIQVVGRQILLNGNPIQLRGFGKHEDFHILGKAVNDALNVRDFNLMKWCGANSFRTAHYPYSEEILALADAEGFLVIDEAPFVNFSEPDFINTDKLAHAQALLAALISRDQNHPSVISWSVGNECASDSPKAVGFFSALINSARMLDSRPIMYVAWTQPEEDNVYPLADIIGFNRYYGWYGYPDWGEPVRPGDLRQAISELDACINRFADRFEKPLILSEFGVDTIAGFHSMFLKQFTEEFQVRFLCDYIQLLKGKECIAGMHIWNFADFNTNQNTTRVNGNRKGLFTRERTPKSAAFAVRKLWTGSDDLGLLALGDTPETGKGRSTWRFE